MNNYDSNGENLIKVSKENLPDIVNTPTGEEKQSSWIDKSRLSSLESCDVLKFEMWIRIF